MQVVNINHVPYNIPISWDELNYTQAVNVIKNVNDKAEQLKAVSGIDVDIIESLNDQQAQSLFAIISFTEDLSPFESSEVAERFKDFDFGSVSYGLAEKVRKALDKDVTGFEAAIDIIKILKDEDISTAPFLDVIGSANFFLNNTLISIVTIPNLEKIRSAMNKLTREPTDSMVLEGLQRTLKSQGREH